MSLLSQGYYRNIYDDTLYVMGHVYDCIIACKGYPLFKDGNRYEQRSITIGRVTMSESSVYESIFQKLYDMAAYIAGARSLSLFEIQALLAPAGKGQYSSLPLPESDVFGDALYFHAHIASHTPEPNAHFWRTGLLRSYVVLAYMQNDLSDGRSSSADDIIKKRLYPIIRMFYLISHDDEITTYKWVLDNWQRDYPPVPGGFRSIPNTWDPPFMHMSSQTKQSSGGCYVATAVYGSYDCPQVWTLRRFRDYDLAETRHGRIFIKAYYAVSPTLVRWFGDTEWFKRMWRGRLDRLVTKCKANGYEDTPYQDRVW